MTSLNALVNLRVTDLQWYTGGQICTLNDLEYMRLALDEARRADAVDEPAIRLYESLSTSKEAPYHFDIPVQPVSSVSESNS